MSLDGSSYRGVASLPARFYRAQRVAMPSYRTFFGILQKPPRQIKKPEYEPGWTTVLTWRNRLLESVRPPTRAELVEAFRELFVYKLRFNVVVNSTQALHCRNLLQYLLENKDDEPGAGLTLAELVSAREALLKQPKEDTKEHLEFSRQLYEAIKAERAQDPMDPGAAEDFESFLVALTLFGASKDGLVVLQEYWDQLPVAERPAAQNLWVNVFQGLAEEGRESELVDAVANLLCEEEQCVGNEEMVFAANTQRRASDRQDLQGTATIFS
ncbi:pentatricopeptide repeat domain-containing protein [Colletotrichum gloeosporioides Cg-14]|uniref:Pentatricopeptide repeat domain-containing protein n=1 Tax=Colletotrichum gloeosporioides (strain Cg-14) TaxID=1237896 RepID=T0M7W6_COLGC|nr:pentatricopeptide repeat domain-containing protein [Colletotrichum gloeosporioides Cg-14]